MKLLDLLNDKLSWHERERWDKTLCLMKGFFENNSDSAVRIKKMALGVKEGISSIDVFIQQNAALVCPDCKKVCCINMHAYYDYQDLVYIYALGLAPPRYKESVKDSEPCQFIGFQGCTIERSLRPFRCNWYFCDPFLKYMGNGPAKQYRQFIGSFHNVIDLRKEMLDEFFNTTK